MWKRVSNGFGWPPLKHSPHHSVLGMYAPLLYLRDVLLLRHADEVLKHGHHGGSRDHMTVHQVGQKTHLRIDVNILTDNWIQSYNQRIISSSYKIWIQTITHTLVCVRKELGQFSRIMPTGRALALGIKYSVFLAYVMFCMLKYIVPTCCCRVLGYYREWPVMLPVSHTQLTR